MQKQSHIGRLSTLDASLSHEYTIVEHFGTSLADCSIQPRYI